MNLHNLWVLLSLVSAAGAFYFPQSLGLKQRRLVTVHATRGLRKSPSQRGRVALKGRTKGSFSHPFLGYATKFAYRIDKDLGVQLDFQVQRRAYTLDLDKWTDTFGLMRFLLHFFMHHKDDDLFGSNEVHLGDGLPLYEAGLLQQRNIVLRAALDVIMTIDAIHQVHGGAMLDYCCRWRLETDYAGIYDGYITYCACCTVVESLLVVPRATYPSITYRSALAMESTSAEEKADRLHGCRGKSEGSFHHPFLGYQTEFRYKIDKDFSVTLEFVLRKRAYNVGFRMLKGSWLSRLLLPLFFTEHNDDKVFGVSEEDVGEEGKARSATYRCNAIQKRNIVLQAALDVILTIDAIHQVHGRWMLGYCCCRWQEMGSPFASYDDFITQVAYSTVIDELLVAPDVEYDSVTYKTALKMELDPVLQKA